MGKRKKKRHPYPFRPPKVRPSPETVPTKQAEDISDVTEPLSEQPGFWGKIFPRIFYYPTSSPRFRSIWFLTNSATLWLILGFGVCRIFFKIPDYSRVPKPMLELAGSLLLFAGTIHTMMIVRVIWTALR